MIGRALWLLLLAALAALAGVAELDRTARSQPHLAPLVPAAFSGFAAERRTEQALTAGSGELAAREAAALIRARPLPAEHLRLLSQAAALGGDTPGALAALEAASARGWRDPLVQLSAARAALLQGRHDAAMQRIGALFATDSLAEQRDSLLAEMLAEDEGRAAFARFLQTPSQARDKALTMAARTVPAELLVPALALVAASAGDLPCAALEQIAANYTADGKEDEAAQFWPGNCS